MGLAVPVTPRDLIEPPAPPVPMKTLTRWAGFLGSIASGIALQDAMLKHYMQRADIEACVRSDPAERQRWDEARLAAAKLTWSAFEIEDVFASIAGGTSIKDAVTEVKGGEQGKHVMQTFTQIVVQDPEMNERYMRALKSRALIASEEILELADDKSDDTLETGGKAGTVPNNANVNRSKLQVETRMRLMSGWYPKLFREKGAGDVQVNVQVNHAARLEDARTRAAGRQPSPPTDNRKLLERAVQDAVFTDVTPAEDTDWMDAPPAAADNSWMDAPP